jgi:hypothetical protein
MEKIEKLEELKIGALYVVRIDSPIGEGLYMEYDDLKFNGVEDEQLSFTDQRVYESSPFYGKPMFIKASNFETGELYSFSIYEQV